MSSWSDYYGSASVLSVCFPENCYSRNRMLVITALPTMGLYKGGVRKGSQGRGKFSESVHYFPLASSIKYSVRWAVS